MDTAATVMDPLGSLLAAGLGWLMDHFEPLKGWLNDLTGDAGEVQAFAQTWANIAQQLQASGDELTRVVGDLDDQAGEAIEAYRRFQVDAAAHIGGAAQWAGAMSTGLSIAGTIVQVVHDLVRDVIAQLVGAAIAWVAEIVFSFGLATPWVVAQVSTRVASVAETVGTSVTAVINSVRNLAGKLDELKAVLSDLGDLCKKVLRGGEAEIPGGVATPGRPWQAGGQIRPSRSVDGGSEWAERAYDGFRAGTEDLDAILRHPDNVKLPNGHTLTPQELGQIKKHVMEDEHLLNDYSGGTAVGRFDASPDMAEAWYRMMNGEAVDSDRLLLLHELTESNYIKANPGATYSEAHAAANASADWEKVINARGSAGAQ